MKTIKEIKSDTLTIVYKGDKVTIDISKELSISESIINSQLKESPSSYAFLTTVKNKYLNECKKLEREKDLAYSEAYIFYKNSNDRMTNEMANHKANSNKKYQAIYSKWLKAQNKAEVLVSICKAYESRENIMRTLSANLRKEQ